MKSAKKTITAILLIMSLVILSFQATQADAAVRNESVSLKIIYEYDTIKIPDATFKLFYVADIDTGCNYTLDGEFVEYPVDINLSSKDYPALAMTIYGYTLLDDIEPTIKAITDDAGEINLTSDRNNLKQGMYLVVSDKKITEDYEFSTKPYLVSVPYYNEQTLHFEFDVKSYPKVLAKTIEKNTDSDETDSNETDSVDTSSETDTQSEISDTPPVTTDTTEKKTDTDTHKTDSEVTDIPPVTTDTTEKKTDTDTHKIDSEITDIPPVTTDTTEKKTDTDTHETESDVSDTPPVTTDTTEKKTDTDTPPVTTDTTEKKTDTDTTPKESDTDTSTIDVKTDTESVVPHTDIPVNTDSEPSDTDSIVIVTETDTNTEYTDPDSDTIVRSVIKIWDDSNNDKDRPDSVTVFMMKDGDIFETVELSANNNWYYSWDKLESDHEWIVVEKPVEKYTVLVDLQGTAFKVTNTKKDDATSDNPGKENGESNRNDSSSDTSSKNSLPQTGTLWWAVIILLAAGLVFYLLGYSVNKNPPDDK